MQEIKDDIGDKSIFQFQAMSPAEQDAILARMKPILAEEEDGSVDGSS